MAFIVNFDLTPRYFPTVRFGQGGESFTRKKFSAFDVFDIDKSDVPGEAIVISRHRHTPEFLCAAGRMIVHVEVRNLIEKREPGLHQFLAISLRHKNPSERLLRHDKSTIKEPYYLINIRSRVDGVCVERFDIEYRAGNNKVLVVRRPTGKIVLNKKTSLAITYGGEGISSLRIYFSRTSWLLT